MIITYKLGDKLSKTLDEEQSYRRMLSFLLLSNKGHYLALAAQSSNYLSNLFGWFNFIRMKDEDDEYSMYKSLDNIYLSRNDGNIAQTSEIVKDHTSIHRISDMGKEQFSVHKSGMTYDAECPNAIINIDLDFRDIHDFDDKGRMYKIYEEDFNTHLRKKSTDNTEKLIVIEYKKYFDNTLALLDKKFYLVIKGVINNYQLLNKWEGRHYSYDLSRDSRAEFYIYKALQIFVDKDASLYFAFSDKKESAIAKILDMLENIESTRQTDQGDIESATQKRESVVKSNSDPEIASAFVNSLQALDSLHMHLHVNGKKFNGLWAGIPWFFQFWSRDELVSLGSLIDEKRYDLVKPILFRHLDAITTDGRLQNVYPSTGLPSADSIGWLFKRISDMMESCIKDSCFDEYFTLQEIKYIHERLDYAIKANLDNHFLDGLIINGKLETWMDTFYKDPTYETDFRDGYRIEMQALFLIMIKLLNHLDEILTNKFVKKSNKLVKVKNKTDYSVMEKEFRSRVRDRFMLRSQGQHRILLNDGFNSSYSDVCRPNIFLTFYLYRELLTDDEWTDAFDYAIEELWCEWMLSNGKTGGGFSTVDKKHFLYQPNYSGQNNRSYHRGDSWFWINNIAAICLNALNEEKYEYYVNKIVSASTEDILCSGFIGYASELSSSSQLKPGGCFCQTWSIATFIELVHKIYLH